MIKKELEELHLHLSDEQIKHLNEFVDNQRVEAVMSHQERERKDLQKVDPEKERADKLESELNYIKATAGVEWTPFEEELFNTFVKANNAKMTEKGILTAPKKLIVMGTEIHSLKNYLEEIKRNATAVSKITTGHTHTKVHW